MSYLNFLKDVIDGSEPVNSAAEMLSSLHGLHITKSLNVTGTGSIVANVLQVTGTVIILDQYATITAAPTLTNATNIYATLYDGTNSVNLTADGMTLSGASVGSFFTKDQISSQPYSVNLADECRMLETENSRRAGRTFTVTQKNGADTFIRLHLTTTDNPIDFTLTVDFHYVPINGSTLVFL